MVIHFLAMFLPGFFSGYLIKKASALIVSSIGVVIFMASMIVFSLGKDVWNYFTGMTLLGFAWNLSYSGATVLLTGCYSFHEAADVQAINDFILLTIAGASCLASGAIFYYFGWSTLIYVCSALVGIYFILFMY